MQTLPAGETVTFNGVYVDDSDSTGTVTDYDGNVYQTIKIGGQWWMAENLKVTHYRNGDPIPNVTDGGIWFGLTTGAYCNYTNDVGYVATYGRLYNWWAAADSRNIAPAGWHVPSDAEWQTLVDYLGGSAVAGGKLKEVGTTHWYPPNTGATNESGFSALAAGLRDAYGAFTGMGWDAFFWSSTERESYMAWSRHLDYQGSQVDRPSNPEKSGFSVRCVRD
ncbi:MAG: fibrobacter succinogenes major paralogous domain-containing protein [candidate division Zixibacteria bacterium]|nr:fibrobacter succinogenes major paralogous domain-containing protein [candidate division Zixibacteria bacterium]